MRFANLRGKELAHSNMVQTISLSCMGQRLYNWEDDREFIHWLANHPTSSTDEVMHVNFIDGFITWKKNKVDIKSDILIDDIKLEDVEMNFDNIKIHKLNDLIKKDNLILSLKFKQNFNGPTIKNNVAIYPQISNNWYRELIEQYHV